MRPTLLSFSSLMKEEKQEKEIEILEKKEGILPLGTETGTLVHLVLERVCKADLHRKIEGGLLEKMVQEMCLHTSLEGFEPTLLEMLQKAFQTPINAGDICFSLSDIKSEAMFLEMEFLYPASGSLLKGFMDMVFCFKGKYYILDWKTNFLGIEKEEYSLEKIRKCMEENNYFLQASIYAEALKKYLTFFEKSSFEKVFGGAVYFFLRGEQPYFFKPNLSLKEEFLCKV